MTRQSEVVLTIDVGLTNCKVSLFGFDGRVLAESARPYATYAPQPDWSEQHPDDWWAAIRQCVDALAAAGHFEAVDVAVISATAHMHGLLAIDRAGSPLTSCWTLFDRRAEAEAQAINQGLGIGRAYQITGGRLEAYTPAAKIAWIMRHEPEIGRRTYKFLAPKDALRLRLCEAWVTDPMDAAGSLLFDLRKGAWSDELIAALGIQQSQLPELRPSSDLAGKLSAAAARDLNLTAGIPVVVGAGDDVEALGAGIVREGQVLEHIGTTGTLIGCTRAYLEDDNQRIEIYPHVIPGLYLVGGATNAAGRSLDWIRKLLYPAHEQGGPVPLEYPGVPAATALPLYLPYILGERGLLWNNQATGLFVGLRESHNSASMARAVYEGVAFSLREILEGIKTLGLQVDELISGSATDVAAWSRLRADLYGMPIYFPQQSNVTGLGAAMLGMVGIQVYDDLKAAAHECAAIQFTIQPDTVMSTHYDRQWRRYEQAVSIANQLFELE